MNYLKKGVAKAFREYDVPMEFCSDIDYIIMKFIEEYILNNSSFENDIYEYAKEYVREHYSFLFRDDV